LAPGNRDEKNEELLFWCSNETGARIFIDNWYVSLLVVVRSHLSPPSPVIPPLPIQPDERTTKDAIEEIGNKGEERMCV
jgi:hypothetical protein